jgi:hypothetical protein
MANKFDGYLGNTLTGDKGDLGSYQHAARLYVDDNFRLAPKVKFLYYVVFNINPKVAASLQSKTGLELNYLVRSADLPKYQLDTEMFNQYNRKTHVYKKITYMPINIVMHDDNEGNVNAMWAQYYGYYFADRGNTSGPFEGVNPAAYRTHTYDSKVKFPFRYGFDNSSRIKEPFFHSIQLFTINRHQFNSYLLCQPKITQWDHDSVNQDDGGATINHRFSVVYDAVLYSNGVVQEDDPAGWAVLHYDKIPSPLASDYVKKLGIEGVYGQSRTNNLLNPIDNNLSKPRDIYSYDRNRGDQLPYGYGSQSFYGRNNNGALGGFSDIAFGLAAGATAGLINAGLGLLGDVFDGNDGVQSDTSSPNTQTQTNNSGVATPENPSGDDSNKATASDAYSPPGFRSGANDQVAETPPGTVGFRSEAASGDPSYGPNANGGTGMYGSPGFRSEAAQEGNTDSLNVSPVNSDIPSPDPVAAAAADSDAAYASDVGNLGSGNADSFAPQAFDSFPAFSY